MELADGIGSAGVAEMDMNVRKSNTIGRLAKALAAAQAEIENVVFDAVNPFYSTQTREARYPTLAAILKVVRPVLSRHGIALVQFTSSDVVNSTASVTTMLMFGTEPDGEWIANTLTMPVTAGRESKPTAQMFGSSISYARRYALGGMCGVAGTDEDDDGNIDGGVQHEPRTAPATREDRVAAGKSIVERVVKAAKPAASKSDAIGAEWVEKTLIPRFTAAGTTIDGFREHVRTIVQNPSMVEQVNRPPEEWPARWKTRLLEWCESHPKPENTGRST